jgi:hypothetical protein
VKTTNCPHCINNKFKKDTISILCPTRGRPDNVRKLVLSALTNAEKPDNIEFLFYVDTDDLSFPKDLVLEFPNQIKVISGPRLWISNSHNVLYAFSIGEILMTAGDDMEFKTESWDLRVRSQFSSVEDKIALVFGNDNATHAGKIAVHGFFHQHWVHCVGTWVQPGRGVPWDLWTTENANLLGRLIFLEDMVISHNHYRQGGAHAEFDQTYRDVYTQSSSFRPMTTYALLKRERRIDRILLREAMIDTPKIEMEYLFAEIFVRTLMANADTRRLLSMTNAEVIRFFFTYPVRKLKIELQKRMK